MNEICSELRSAAQALPLHTGTSDTGSMVSLTRFAPLHRRGFLKLAGAGTAGLAVPRRMHALKRGIVPAAPVRLSVSAAAKGVPSHFDRNASRTAALDGVTLEYFDFGNPQGVPVVLVHGFPDSPLCWEAVAAGLDLTKLRIIAPYLRGYGRSTVTRDQLMTGQMAALGYDLLALLDVLKIQSCHLVGHDWGAHASYAVSLLAPARVLSLTALASPYVRWAGGPLPPEQLHAFWYAYYFQTPEAQTALSEQSADFCRALWKAWSPTYEITNEAFAATALAWSNPQFVSTVLSFYRTTCKTMQGKPAYSDLQIRLETRPAPRIMVPTIFIQGDVDGCELLAGAKGQETYFAPTYERLVLRNNGHFPHRESPDTVADAISRQVKRS